jgi:hypothetical protein
MHLVISVVVTACRVEVEDVQAPRCRCHRVLEAASQKDSKAGQS